ncbi:hypothetical protein [Pseudomonas brassicacearum]|uniref:hypothetical protein n=1 Tax=Pseudomonas brassicacearum TaxID=930166 RepID=UPI00057985FE|nr:hypothetical protein [Pseudomonas brassicacearum]
MNDFRDLKAIAGVCQQHQPLRFMPSHGALYIRNDNGIVFDVHQNRSFPEFMAQNKDYADLVLAANPATILALFAEIERLQREEKNDLIAYKAAIERQNELRAEIAGLRTGYEAYERVNAELKAEVERLRKSKSEPCDGCFMAEAEALRKDAERYRFVSQLAWYVDQAAWVYNIGKARSPWADDRAAVDADDVEAAIDAALGQGEQS